MNPGSFTLALKSVSNNHNNSIHLHCNFRLKDWQKLFIQRDISEGSIIEIKNLTFYGSLFQVYRTMIENVALFKKDPLISEIIFPENQQVDSISNIFSKANISLEDNFNQFIQNEKITLINGSEFHNPLYLFKRFATKVTLALESTGAGHGDLNLGNILLHMKHNRKNDNSESFPELQDYEIKFIDLSSFKMDYPLAFDYVKLEVEIKNHILSKDLRKSYSENDRTLSEKDLKLKFTNDVILFENYLANNMQNSELTQSICDNSEFSPKMNQLIPLLLKLRQAGIKRYDRNQLDANKLYFQQLFFYSLHNIKQTGKRADS
jgi:hypothetical protein